MSAAAPVPPYQGGASSSSFNNNRPPSSSGNNGGEKAYEHIQDLQLKALNGFKRDGSVHQLLLDAELALSQARTLLDFRRPDMSYVEYLRAFEIVAEVIPRNKGWPDLQYDHSGGSMQKYQILQKKITAQSEQFTKIKDIIVNNNRRSGVQPISASNGGHVRGGSSPQMNGSSVNGVKIKPSPSPKPESLHGRSVSTATTANGALPSSMVGDPLKDRLAALRSRNPGIDTSQYNSPASNPSSVHSSPISTSMPDASDYGSRASLDTLSTTFSKTSLGPSSRPQGPRGMPNGNSGPPLPGKLPVDTSIGAMPQAPKATYSPARNMQTTGNIELPRSTPRSLASTSNRRTSMAPSSSASSYAPNGIDSGDYFPAPTRTNTQSSVTSQMTRRQSLNVPKETRISNERLYDYLDRFNILLIDFRLRHEFDQGHIFHRNIMCIDPIHVTQGMSAEQLLERMVISPEVEQEMFVNRDKYDLVVYYDTQTQSETFLTKPIGELQTKLKYLHEALDDFNYDKALQRPPILLIGGIDAWVELIGNQSLATSDTASRVKQGRPLQRRPVGGAQLRIPKKRLREYNPIDKDEEHQWLQRARAESVHLPTPKGFIGENGETIHEEPEQEEDDQPPDTAAIEDFNARFPDAGALDRLAFASQQPTRSAPQPPPKVPLAMYPSAPQASTYPSVPARPAPAAPRTSYMGVSDRAGSQNVPAARSTSLVPYIPAKYLTDSYRLPKTGLENFRFTCYMNATLQALSHTKPLSIYFMLDDYRRHVQRESWKGTHGIMPELYSNLIKSLWKDDVNYIRPTTFRTFCGRQNSQWIRDDEEQDAKEFFDFLVDVLHEDLNVKWSKPPLKELTVQEEARRERMPKSVVAQIEWHRYTHRNESFIQNVFAGQMSSHLQFDCGHTSTRHEWFFALSIEIPADVRRPTLDDCLKSFCKKERLIHDKRHDERAKCDQCGEKRETIKQLAITRAPQVLVVHFKRFTTSLSGATLSKNVVPIHFPLEDFDLEPYTLSQPAPAEADAIARDFGPDYSKPDPSMNPPYKYEAYAVVRHHGHSIQSGHYTTVVKDKNKGKWRSFNDRTHTEFVPGNDGTRHITSGDAYIVFYQRTLPAPMGPGGVGKI